MSNLLLIDGSVLIKVWAIGFFGFNMVGFIHIIPIIACLALVMRYLYDKSLLKQKKLNYSDFKM